MTHDRRLESTSLAILGLGLMGGSLALALRGRCRAVYGVDPNPQVLAYARQHGVVDHATHDPAEVLPEAGLVILASPVSAILSTIAELPSLHPGPAVVLDLGSTKSRICQAMERLPARFDPLGGHPMCGKEVSGLANADPALFQGAVFAFTPLARTSLSARALAEQLADAVGARPLWLDPALHDRWAAATSHLPYLLSLCLALATPSEARPLLGPGFRSTARLAGSSPQMMLDILATNRPDVLAALQRFQGELEALAAALQAEDAQALAALLADGRACYGSLLHPDDPPAPASGGPQ
jgi:prephenate dehydrogenase